jgi:hypothetical protein
VEHVILDSMVGRDRGARGRRALVNTDVPERAAVVGVLVRAVRYQD